VRLCLKYDFSYPGNSRIRPISVASGIRDDKSEPSKYFDPRCSKGDQLTGAIAFSGLGDSDGSSGFPLSSFKQLAKLDNQRHRRTYQFMHLIPVEKARGNFNIGFQSQH
jgi:hypothetical protein